MIYSFKSSPPFLSCLNDVKVKEEQADSRHLYFRRWAGGTRSIVCRCSGSGLTIWPWSESLLTVCRSSGSARLTSASDATSSTGFERIAGTSVGRVSGLRSSVRFVRKPKNPRLQLKKGSKIRISNKFIRRINWSYIKKNSKNDSQKIFQYFPCTKWKEFYAYPEHPCSKAVRCVPTKQLDSQPALRCFPTEFQWHVTRCWLTLPVLFLRSSSSDQSFSFHVHSWTVSTGN